MSPYLFTVLADQAALIGFAVVTAIGAGRAARRRATVDAVALGVAFAVVATGLAPLLGPLITGGLVPDSVPGIAVAQTVPYALLTGLVLLRPRPGPRHTPVDATSLVAFGLALHGIAGFALGLVLLAQRWLVPGPARRGMVLAIVELGMAWVIDDQRDLVRTALGDALGLSIDARVRLVHLAVSLAELTGWSVIATTVLHFAPGRAKPQARVASPEPAA